MVCRLANEKTSLAVKAGEGSHRSYAKLFSTPMSRDGIGSDYGQTLIEPCNFLTKMMMNCDAADQAAL